MEKESKVWQNIPLSHLSSQGPPDIAARTSQKPDFPLKFIAMRKILPFLSPIAFGPLLALGILAVPLDGLANATCPISEEGIYIVQSGDSLSLISLRCFGSAKKGIELGTLNNLTHPKHLRVGAKLQFPAEWVIIDSKRSADLELAYWRKRFQLSGKASVPDSLQPKPIPVSEVKTNQEMAVLEAQKTQSPEKGLEVTRTLLKEEPTLVSARITEIKLLMKSGKNAEAQLRARALISAHPELKDVPKIREWANLKEATNPGPTESTNEDFAQ